MEFVRSSVSVWTDTLERTARKVGTMLSKIDKELHLVLSGVDGGGRRPHHFFVGNDLFGTFYVHLLPYRRLASTHSLWRPPTSCFRTTPLESSKNNMSLNTGLKSPMFFVRNMSGHSLIIV